MGGCPGEKIIVYLLSKIYRGRASTGRESLEVTTGKEGEEERRREAMESRGKRSNTVVQGTKK